MQVILPQILAKVNKPIRPFIGRCRKRIYYIYFTHPVSGKRTKKSTYTSIRTKAEIELTKFLRNQSSEILLNNLSKEVRLDNLLNIILSTNSRIKAPNTLSLCKTAFSHLMRIIGNKHVIQVSRIDADIFLNSIMENLQKTTVNMYLRQLKTAFYNAISYELVTTNPFKNIKELIVPDKIRPNIKDDEIEKLLNIIQDDLVLRIVKFTLLTGMRRSEIMFLQWKDIDFESRTIKIRNKENFATKTRKDRTIALTPKIESCLGFLNKIMNENIIEFRNEDNYVFGNKNGFRFSPGYISRIFKKYFRKAKLNDKICFHSLRHTALTKMALDGIPINVIKAIAGHTLISTTQKYLHSDIEILNYYMEKLDYGF